jgi:predicted ArsR family transcriptional regulator
LLKDATGSGPPQARQDHATYRALASGSRQALLAALRDAGRPLDAAEAGTAVGLHLNTARVHLELLCSVGMLKRRPEQRSARGRPRVLYEVVPGAEGLVNGKGSGEDAAAYRELAAVLAQQLAELPDLPNEALRAGRRWAAALNKAPVPAAQLSPEAALDVIAGLLYRLGFRPEADLAGGQILLHHCPFAAVARQNGAVVCAVHLGMLKAVLERLDAPLDVLGLEPFARDDPLLCVVRVVTRAGPPALSRRSSTSSAPAGGTLGR